MIWADADNNGDGGSSILWRARRDLFGGIERVYNGSKDLYVSCRGASLFHFFFFIKSENVNR